MSSRKSSSKARVRAKKPVQKSSPKRGKGSAQAVAVGKAKGNRGVGKLFETLVALQARLRAPNGCPWDREQDHDSLRTYLVEETYEVLDALESRDWQEFAGELGDLLLQVVFHAQLAAEAGRFDISDVVERIYTKMVSRHPHVFGEVEASTSAQVLKNWEQIKAEERAAKGGAAKPSSEEPLPSILDAVPRSIPALLEAHQLTRRASNVGFDWKNVEGILDKLVEETRELREALNEKDRTRREEEVGDLLFVCVNLARFLGFDAEIALKRSNRKFSQRFRSMERAAASRGEQLSQISTDELESLWNEAKARAASGAAAANSVRVRKT